MLSAETSDGFQKATQTLQVTTRRYKVESYCSLNFAEHSLVPNPADLNMVDIFKGSTYRLRQVPYIEIRK